MRTLPKTKTKKQIPESDEVELLKYSLALAPCRFFAGDLEPGFRKIPKS
jgi:hypothetical protein